MPTPSTKRDAESEVEGLSLADEGDERPPEMSTRQRYVSYSSMGSSAKPGQINVCCTVQTVMHALHIFIAVAIILWIHQIQYSPEKAAEPERISDDDLTALQKVAGFMDSIA